jgi:dephospho-CoA kinase
VIDADAISRALTAPAGKRCRRLAMLLARRFYDGEKLNRAALAQLVFSDPDARMRLNELMHPLILRNMQNRPGWRRRKALARCFGMSRCFLKPGLTGSQMKPGWWRRRSGCRFSA